MPITFDSILEGAGITPSAVHLVRHQDKRGKRRGTPYTLWRKNRAEFERYQSTQSRPVFRIGNFVASFVVAPGAATLFAGLYRVHALGVVPDGMRDPLLDDDVSGLHLYDLARDSRLDEYIEVLSIDWGAGYRSWAQRAGRGDKRVVELRRMFEDKPFPGYLRLIEPLSDIESLPDDWIARLREAKGVYLLTCPRTKEHYVGAAGGEDGFFGRWLQHAAIGGDAVRFRGRERSAYQVSILEVAGSASSNDDILRTEQLWMSKLQTVAMGLNGHPRLMVAAATDSP